MNTIHPDKRILNFIKHHHLFTLATLHVGKPWTASCFYVYLEDTDQFVFTSDLHTQHAHDMLDLTWVAGNISLETRIIGKIQGIQFTGRSHKLEGEEQKRAEKDYLKRFPVAILMETVLWAVDVEFIKMTDNNLGFGKKLYWDKGSEATMESRM